MSKYPTDKRLGTIYKIENKLNHKVYIGQTIMDVRDRWYRHCENSGISEAEKNMPIKRAILKYGKDNFIFSVVEKVHREELNDREIYWINYYQSYGSKGYNATSGGTIGSRKPKLTIEQHLDIVDLYNAGFSLRDIAKEFNVDHATIKHSLERMGVELRKTRTYKFTPEERQKMVDMISEGYSRLEVQKMFKVSRTFLYQLLVEQRRI